MSFWWKWNLFFLYNFHSKLVIPCSISFFDIQDFHVLCIMGPQLPVGPDPGGEMERQFMSINGNYTESVPFTHVIDEVHLRLLTF